VNGLRPDRLTTDAPAVSTTSGALPDIAAVLIVRDEAEQLPACLASLAGLVDEIVVHDTGSVDDSVRIARASGAVVRQGYWDGDFARARNEALDVAAAPWALVLDADERAHGNRHRLRSLLAGTDADVLTVTVRNVQPEELGGDYRHPGPRLLRREWVRYVGPVHEQPRSHRPGPTRQGLCPPQTLELEHLGYADGTVVRAKARRNAEIAEAEVERLTGAASVDLDELSGLLLGLGRSLVVCDRRQEAVHAFEALRELVPGSRRALEGTDALARLLLGAGQDAAVLVLVDELRAAGTDQRYCDWLRAQALAQLGRPAEALELLRGVDLLRDTAGRELELGQVLEVRALVAALCGRPEEACTSLAQAMAGYGRANGRGGLLLDLWATRPTSELARLLAASGRRTREVAAELAGCRHPGPEVAELLVTSCAGWPLGSGGSDWSVERVG
jgi:tetratricopeptide (TPR) repeat protein